MMSNAIKDLSVSFSSLIGFEVKFIAHSPTNGIRARVIGSSHGSVIVREGLLRGHNLTPYNHFKN